MYFYVEYICAFFQQSEPEGFSHFHLYVCAAFLVRWKKEILEEKDFQVNKTFLFLLKKDITFYFFLKKYLH